LSESGTDVESEECPSESEVETLEVIDHSTEILVEKPLQASESQDGTSRGQSPGQDVSDGNEQVASCSGELTSVAEDLPAGSDSDEEELSTRAELHDDAQEKKPEGEFDRDDDDVVEKIVDAPLRDAVAERSGDNCKL